MTVAELREKLEEGVRDFLAYVEDENITEVGTGTYQGNSFIHLPSIAIWLSGPSSACGLNVVTASSATATLQATKCPNGAKTYTIKVP
jgi:hypothetical protein